MKFAVFALIGGASAVSIRHMSQGPYDTRINYGATSQTAIKT